MVFIKSSHYFGKHWNNLEKYDLNGLLKQESFLKCSSLKAFKYTSHVSSTPREIYPKTFFFLYFDKIKKDRFHRNSNYNRFETFSIKQLLSSLFHIPFAHLWNMYKLIKKQLCHKYVSILNKNRIFNWN